jgi:hypothetical protein
MMPDAEVDYDAVICPNCVHQFKAIPVNVQGELRELRDTVDRYRAALKRVADLPSGAIPGHAVAVGCRHNVIARKALTAPDEVECTACDGKGYNMDYGPWKTEGVANTRTFKILGERAEPDDPTNIYAGKRVPCDQCDHGWLTVMMQEA